MLLLWWEKFNKEMNTKQSSEQILAFELFFAVPSVLWGKGNLFKDNFISFSFLKYATATILSACACKDHYKQVRSNHSESLP